MKQKGILPMLLPKSAVSKAQAFMQKAQIDVWIIYNFQTLNRVFGKVLSCDSGTSRRSICFIFSNSDPVVLHHPVDTSLFRSLDCTLVTYRTWQEFPQRISDITAKCDVAALDYVPGGQLPIASWVDGGFIEMVRSLGKSVVSSAELFQASFAACSEEQASNHIAACKLVEVIKNDAFALVRSSLRAGSNISEYDIQQFILQRFDREGLETEDSPIVAVNEHSGDPHYEPTRTSASLLKPGDWLLIDLWAKHRGENGVFGDITWVAHLGHQPTDRHKLVFDTVKRARDSVLSMLHEKSNTRVEGWQLDRCARDIITGAGFGENFPHRTGHSIGPGSSVHGLGMNLDDFETHDTRAITPGIAFSVEPGVYLQDFGVRLECNVLIGPNGFPQVHTPLQQDIILIN